MIRGIEGNPVSNYCGSSSPFTDVDVNAVWSCWHIKRLMERGITYGCNSPAPNQVGTMYCPNLEMTRWQMAVMIIRALYGEDSNYPTTPYFSDVSSSDIGFKYIQKRHGERREERTKVQRTHTDILNPELSVDILDFKFKIKN